MNIKSWIKARSLIILMLPCLIFCLSACTPSQSPTSSPKTQSAPSVPATSGNIAIFTPADGITLSQHTPLNKWAAFVPELEKALMKQGFSKNAITTNTEKSLDKQSQEVQDYVVAHLNPKDSKIYKDKENPTTIVIAPVVPSVFTQQYGDYIGHDLNHTQFSKVNSEVGDHINQPDNGDDSDDTEKNNQQDIDDNEQHIRAYRRLVTSLQLAQKNGIHVVVLSNDIKEITPDLFVRMSTPEQIGQMQAKQVVSKLELEKASAANPKYIEVLLPESSFAENIGAQVNNKNDEDFTEQAFAGIWEVLAPYFLDGRAVSPSGLLNNKSNKKDWKSVSFESQNIQAVEEEIEKRLSYSRSSGEALPQIDGVIAMNDYIASGVITALNNMGYTGTSADINPEISITGIVNSMTGKRDVQRRPVPKPHVNTAKPEPDSEQDGSNPSGLSENTKTKENKKHIDRPWPIVTGYGAYVDNLPQIVDGRQWMTGLEDRQGVAQSLAVQCKKLNSGISETKLTNVNEREIQGRKLLTLEKDLIAISAGNLKNKLIDTGYIRPADAGL